MDTPSQKQNSQLDQTIYKKLFEVSLDPIGIAGLDGYFYDVNSSFYRILGYSRDEILSTPFINFIHPDDRPSTLNELKKIKSAKVSISFENRYMCQDKSYKWFEWTCVPVEGQKIIAIARDITQKKRNHEHFLETIIDNIPDMIFVKEAKDLRFVRFNKAGEELLGFSRGDLIGKNDYDIFPRSQADFFVSKDRSVFEGGTLIDIPEEPIETRFNGARILHTKKIPLYDTQGNPQYLVGISEDITEKKQAAGLRQKIYQEQIAREEAEKSLSSRDEFISIASHELKSPISSLKLQAQLFQRKLSQGSPESLTPEKINQLIDLTITQTNRLDRLVNDMLDVSRIRTGKLTMVYSNFNFVDLVKEVLHDMQNEFNHAGVTPSFTFKPESIIGHWDYMRIEQVVINLLTNALRYGKSRPIDIRLSKKKECVELSVHDQGIGISQDNLEKIFDRFERAVGRNEVSGLGLGLFISKQIIELHQGRIWAESQLDVGSSFFINLPFASK